MNRLPAYRSYAVAAMLGGVLVVLLQYAFMLTHGASGTNYHRELWGLTYLDVSRAGVIWQALVLVAIAGLHLLQRDALGRFGKASFWIVVASLAMVLLGQISHNWIVDPTREFLSPWVQAGWLLRIYGTFLGILGMTLYGIASVRAGSLGAWSWAPLGNGLALAVLLVLEVTWIPTLPELTAYRESMTTAVAAPYGLSWVLIGVAILRRSSGQRAASAHPVGQRGFPRGGAGRA